MIPVPGEIWVPSYPVHNRIGVPLEWIKRHILVEAVEDFSKTALCIDAFIARPALRRGAMLIRGRDVRLQSQRRQLYLEATPDFYLPRLRIGIVAADGTLLGWAGRPYRQETSDLQQLLEKAIYWRDRMASTELRPGIFRAEPWE